MERIKVGHVNDIEPLRSRVVFVKGLELALFKLSTGEVKAIENKCPHKAGKLSEGIVCDHHVYCPLHDWKINLHDGIVQAPDEGCVPAFRIITDSDSGELFIELQDHESQAS